MITAVNAVENIRNAGIDDIAALEDLVVVGELAEAVPDPPDTVDNWANPTDAGEERYTEYTFFRNESPTIQPGPEL